MTRDEALEELKLRLSDKAVLQRAIAVEAIMKEFAGVYNADADMWGMTGLLHDIDYQKTAGNPSMHGLVGADIIENMDVDQAIVYSVKAHNDLLCIPRKRKMDKVLYLSDPVSDIIFNYIMKNDRRISEVTAEDIIGMLNEVSFNEEMEKLKQVEELDMDLREFIETALRAIQGISRELDI